MGKRKIWEPKPSIKRRRKKLTKKQIKSEINLEQYFQDKEAREEARLRGKKGGGGGRRLRSKVY